MSLYSSHCYRDVPLMMIKAQAWIFLTVGLGLSLLAGVVVTVCILCILSRRNKRRERR